MHVQTTACSCVRWFCRETGGLVHISRLVCNSLCARAPRLGERCGCRAQPASCLDGGLAPSWGPGAAAPASSASSALLCWGRVSRFCALPSRVASSGFFYARGVPPQGRSGGRGTQGCFSRTFPRRVLKRLERGPLPTHGACLFFPRPRHRWREKLRLPFRSPVPRRCHP